MSKKINLFVGQWMYDKLYEMIAKDLDEELKHNHCCSGRSFLPKDFKTSE